MRQMRTLASEYGYPMNFRAYVTRGIIWGQRQVFSKFLKAVSSHSPMRHDYEWQAANDAIRVLLLSGKPCFVGRFGCVELDAILRGWDISRSAPKFVKFLQLFTGGFGPFWWDNSIKAGLLRTTGVFPADEEILARFSSRMLEDSRQLDVLASWNAREQQLAKEFFPDAKGIGLRSLEPFHFNKPWSSALNGRKVLVVHPFQETIKSQYARRKDLFSDKEVLPDFDLITYKPVLSFLGLNTPFKDWFEALDKMCNDITQIDFDVAIIGCGAYGFPIGAFVKRDLHRQAVHFGGATQLLFGIKGKRWDNDSRVSPLYNDFWVRPSTSERPQEANQVERACYW